MRRHAAMAVVDTIMFLVFLALSSPGAATGFMVHEWFGLALLLLLALHLVLSWGWVAPAVRRAFSRRDARSRINVLLNSTILIMMSVATISGLVISDYVLPGAGLPTSDDPRWRNVHNMTASFLLAVVGLHVALNWTWIRAAFRRYVMHPLGASRVRVP
jgi:cytochrome b561